MMRIRPNREESDVAVINEKNARYSEWLTKVDFSAVPDLFEYFSEDFFHDGAIFDLNFSADRRRLRFQIAADFPVLKQEEARDIVGHSAWGLFSCVFHHVTMFRFVHFAGNEQLRYDCSEINTLEEDIEQCRAKGDGASSLIIETNGGSIDVVFGGLSVSPAEPMGFHLLVQSGIYDVRLPSRRTKPVGR